MSAEIERATRQEVELVGGSGGIFEIRQGGEVIWKKNPHGDFPYPGEIAELLG